MNNVEEIDQTQSELYLTDLIDVSILQQIQDAFSNMTGMAALTTDAEGNPVTKGSNFTDFCTKYTRKSKLGNVRCEGCDSDGAKKSLANGKACAYYCHAGLVDFAAPIMANDKMVGSIIGGQILPGPPDLEKFEKIAKELDIDPEEYKEAVKRVRITDKQTIDKAAQSLFTFASVMSDLAYKSHSLYLSNIEIEKASHLKSDFLANMSHEIRTPMNAILGMVDLALREEMSPAARDFIKQIKVSGKNLLVIINDILDFSKIEAGKMDIIEAMYEPLSVINDVSSIVNTRIGSKSIEFTMDISTNLPKELIGDSSRLHQILINLLNNAVKFTREGEVHLSIDCEPYKEVPETVMLKVAVSDTGIGIKKQDMDKIFNSFQQLDSKRNRNIEGTGLGLTISQNLVELMHGSMHIESVYNKGSTFSFEVPQEVVNPAPAIPSVDGAKMAVLLMENYYVEKQIYKDLNRIGVSHTGIDSLDAIDEVEYDYIIVGEKFINNELLDYLKSKPDKICIAVTNYAYRNVITDIPNMRVLRKPVYSLSLYNAMGISHYELESTQDVDAFTFTAPDAKVIVVDDNSVNLTVALGLLEPLKMQIDTAGSAAEAIEKLHQKNYDLIFMDHMMPEVDGIEATHIIRRVMHGYDDVPIIALTANAVSGAKEMFIKEGMNDFVAKPIEITDIISKLKIWLPHDKIILEKKDKAANTAQQNKILPDKIEGLNIEDALKLLGNETLYRNILKEYFSLIDKKSGTIEQHFNDQNLREYTIEVHALKSSSKQIGANKLSRLAAELEKAGNEKNTTFIEEKTSYLLAEYRKFKEILAPLFPELNEEKTISEINNDGIISLLDELKEALDNFDTLQIDEVIEKMSSFNYTDEQNALFNELKEAAESTDIERCGEIEKSWRELL